MNRRTFIKLTGATAVAVTTPLMAFASESQWIDFVNQMPKIGQKIAMLTYFENHKSMNVCTGVVDKAVGHWHSRRYRYNGGSVLVELAVSYSSHGFFRRGVSIHAKPAFIDCDVCLYDLALHDGITSEVESRGAIQRKIHRAKWIDREVVYPCSGSRLFAPRHGSRCSKYMGRDRSYWFPIDEYIPEHLPTFPDPLPLVIDGDGNLRK